MVAEGKLDDVVADIAGPAGNVFAEASPLAGKQGARGLLEAGKVARHRGHEVIGRIPSRAMTIAVAAEAIPSMP